MSAAIAHSNLQAPGLLVHGFTGSKNQLKWLQSLPAELDRLILTEKPVEGENCLAPAGELHDCLAALDKRWQNRHLLLVHAMTELPPFAWQRLVQAMEQENLSVVSPLSIQSAPLLKGLDELLPDDVAKADSWLYNLSAKKLEPAPPVLDPVCCLVSKTHLAKILSNDDLSGRFARMDYLFVKAPRKLAQALDLDADPLDRNQPGMHLLLEAFQGRVVNAHYRPAWPGFDKRPLVLHVSHSWGGGSEQWLKSYTDTEDSVNHLVLRSQGSWQNARQGRAFILQLGTNGPVLRRWMLANGINSVALANEEYRQILESLLTDFPVDRVLVSSLIGHSLDCLDLPVPTHMLMHDYFPLCAGLNTWFDGLCQSCNKDQLGHCLNENPLAGHFHRDPPATWFAVRARLSERLQAGKLQMMMPSAHMKPRLQMLLPDLPEKQLARVGHGLPESLMTAGKIKMPTDTARTGELRVLVPGRLLPQKGLDLLKSLLRNKALRQRFTFYLVGCGKEGRALERYKNVHLTESYQREELAAHLKQIKPHFGLLLSLVPETFSYTLDELRQFGIPVLATRTGAFAERLQDGVEGRLFDPSDEALAETLQNLHAEREQIKTYWQGLKAYQSRAISDMVSDYAGLMQLASVKSAAFHGPTWKTANEMQEQASSAESWYQLQRKLELEEENQRQDAELEERARWNLDLQAGIDDKGKRIKALDKELAERLAWIETLKAEQQELGQKHKALWEEKGKVEKSLAESRQLSENLSAELERVYQSTSWRVTRPLRESKILLRRWRNRLQHRKQKIQGLYSGLLRNLRMRGVRGTWRRAMEKWALARQQSQPRQIEQVNALKTYPALAFDVPEGRPDVSIVIPVYGQVHHSWACLDSLLKSKNRVSYEVIVVDDQSPDETASVLSGMSGIKVVNNRINLGFIGSCNKGAELSKGRYLVFLNNDTTVTDAWLDALVDTFAEFPDAGLVGSRLIYPDGRLQEAGGIVFSDGSGWNYGRFGKADDPACCYAREADYCSGAAIMIETNMFNELGGFDTLYTPAYYEDTDLAFKVRAAGKKVIYQPVSEVVHYEGISCGTDTTSGVKKYQEVNREKFLKRWQKALGQQPAPGSKIERAKEHRVRHRVLIIDACTPTPDQDSGSVRMINMMRILRNMGCKLTFFADNLAEHQPYVRQLQAMGVETLFAPWLQSPPAFFEQRGDEFDMIFISRHYIACKYTRLVSQFAPQAKLVFDTVDLHYLREQRMAELKQDKGLAEQALNTREAEFALMRHCDVSLVVSPFEQSLLQQELPEANVQILSNIHPVHGRRKSFAERRDIMFIGGFQHPPNIDSVEFFVSEIFPLVRKQLPDVRFHIIGSKATEEVKKMAVGEGVVFHGFVEDIEPFLDDTRMLVAPLRYGAGVKGKVNMSMSFGQPVVASPMAIEGMNAEHEVDVLVAEEAADFAREVVRLYQDEALWLKLSDNGLENVRRYFSFEAAEKTLTGLLS